MAELLFDVPLNYCKPNDGNLRLFARSVRRLETPVDPANGKSEKQLPWLVYLQGGPGMGCRPPQEYGWVGTALDKGYQVCIQFLSQIFLFGDSCPHRCVGAVPRPARYRHELDDNGSNSRPSRQCSKTG